MRPRFRDAVLVQFPGGAEDYRVPVAVQGQLPKSLLISASEDDGKAVMLMSVRGNKVTCRVPRLREIETSASCRGKDSAAVSGVGFGLHSPSVNAFYHE